jgi:HTH-type transcriptional regulator / antitoxin MqsA
MSFWENETCEYCDGPIVERRVTLHKKTRDGYVQLENVPAGVCRKCGTRYFAAHVLKQVQESIQGTRKADREICMPVYSFSGSSGESLTDTAPNS